MCFMINLKKSKCLSYFWLYNKGNRQKIKFFFSSLVATKKFPVFFSSFKKSFFFLVARSLPPPLLVGENYPLQQYATLQMLILGYPRYKYSRSLSWRILDKFTLLLWKLYKRTTKKKVVDINNDFVFNYEVIKLFFFYFHVMKKHTCPLQNWKFELRNRLIPFSIWFMFFYI